MTHVMNVVYYMYMYMYIVCTTKVDVLVVYTCAHNLRQIIQQGKYNTTMSCDARNAVPVYSYKVWVAC